MNLEVRFVLCGCLCHILAIVCSHCEDTAVIIFAALSSTNECPHVIRIFSHLVYPSMPFLDKQSLERLMSNGVQMFHFVKVLSTEMAWPSTFDKISQLGK